MLYCKIENMNRTLHMNEEKDSYYLIFQFKAHSTILSLTTPNIDWLKIPNPLYSLPDDVVKATLHYMYAESLPRGLSEETAAKCVQTMTKIPELKDFVKLCDTFLKNTALKQRKSNNTNFPSRHD